VRIQIEHRVLIEQLCHVLNAPISEYCFSNIYLFRNVHEYGLLELGNGQYGLTGFSDMRKKFFMPLFHPIEWNSCIEIAKTQAAHYIYPVPEDWWPECQQFSIQVVDGDSDYVFETEKIRQYKGRHFDGHRYNIRKLLESVTIQARSLEGESIQDAKRIVNEWEQMQGQKKKSSDVGPCLEALDCMGALDMKGYVFYVNGKSIGFIIGQALMRDMFVFHFAKAVSTSLGLYQYMYQYFAQNIPDHYTFLNWEQDLGLPGLRKAKTSFHPSRMVKKGRIIVRPLA
jgi:hypothetical protein